MEDILRPIYQERASSSLTLGILLIEKRAMSSNLTESFNYILLVITENDEPSLFMKHYTYKEMKAALVTVSIKQVREWLLLGSNRRFIEWMHQGKILFDRNENVARIKQEIEEFPFYGRKLKKGLEFAKLIHRYTDGRAFYDAGQYMDAYNYIVHSLHHLARLAIIESGFYPEVTVWEQVKHIEPQIYKLYEELITSEESLQKRLELLILAIEFLIYSKSKSGMEHFTEVLSSKEGEPWTIGELLEHPDLKNYRVDLMSMLEYLIEKKFVEVIEEPSKGDLFHRLYRVQ